MLNDQKILFQTISGSNENEGVLHIPSSGTGVSLSDFLVSHLGLCRDAFGVFYNPKPTGLKSDMRLKSNRLRWVKRFNWYLCIYVTTKKAELFRAFLGR